MDRSSITNQDLQSFAAGTHSRLYERLGAQPVSDGTHFAVWAPNAEAVSVVGSFNDWDSTVHPLTPSEAGIWTGFVDKIGRGTIYKYRLRSRIAGYTVDKTDPFAFLTEVPPKTAAVVWELDYPWHDADWMANRGERQRLDRPISIYEIHLGSWRRKRPYESYSYRELAPLLAEYLNELSYTHVELMPVAEHPYYPSWGYHTTGYFAPTARYGTPEDLMFFVDYLHQHEIGVILDWVPSHFATDEHGLAYFDGTHLYEHSDPRQGWHPDWDSAIFNYGRHEVRSFLLSSACYWLERYHFDGLRVDGVASMLYLDYSRRAGQWIPNPHGGNENLEAISFLKALNRETYGRFPGITMMAEESTAWPGVSRPTDVGGLGFGLKWDMGWMHDTLRYLGRDPVHRAHHHNELSFRGLYAFSENFVLPLSHDEVVHGKGSLFHRMPGDDWQRFSNLRLLYGYMFGLPGKKLLFMGNEWGQRMEWDHDRELSWEESRLPSQAGLKTWVRDLNRLYQTNPGLWMDCDPAGFEWIDASDAAASVIAFLRRGEGTTPVVVLCNFTPIPRHHYRVGVPLSGWWRELLNSDASIYRGSGTGNLGGVEAEAQPMHGRPWSIELTLPPLSVVFLQT